MTNLKELWELNEDGPDPIMEKCVRCKGKGYFNGGGFTKNASRNKGECYLCKGRQEYPSNYYCKCLKCNGYGFWHANGRGNPWQPTVKPCTNCEGAGYQKLEDPDNELRPIQCLMCKGKGQYHYKGWCHQGLEKFIKGDCPRCEGKGVLLGNYSRCKRCKGKGAFGKNGVCSVWQNPVYIKKHCEDCEGKGVLLGNYSRCKRCKGKGAFGTSGVMSVWQNPVHIKKHCEDCEGKGFLKEEEPVEDDSDSVETEPDSNMKNQPEDDDDYAGIQPEEDPDYYAGSENESEEEEIPIPIPDPEEAECDRCKGKKYVGRSGFVDKEKLRQRDCPCCEGKGVYNKNWYRECLKCEGKGFWSTKSSGTTQPWITSALPCNRCDGKGFSKIDFRTDLEEQKCLLCKGRAHLGKSSWTSQGSNIKQGDCPCCIGQGVILGNWTKCNTCKGKGGFRNKTPMFPYVKSRTHDCEDCNGRGFIPENPEPSKKEEEDEEKDKEKEEEKPKEYQKINNTKIYHELIESELKGNEEEPKEDENENKEEEEQEKEKEEEPKKEESEKEPSKKEEEEEKPKEEEEEPKEEEKEPEPEPEPEFEPGFRACDRCGGKGHYNKFGWCDQGSPTKIGDCPVCKGAGKYEFGNWRECVKCGGKGCFNTFGPYDIWKSHWSKQPCSSCNEVGYLSSRPESQLKAQDCLLCGTGNGHYGTFGFVKQQKRKGECPLCKGKCEIYGDYNKCDKCEGKGAFNTFGPCEIWKSNKTEDCSECNGCGYTRSEEQDKLEQEEFEKYGYNNKNHWEIEPFPEKPEGVDGECCIIL